MISRGEKVHSVTTDPPYHLESIVKRFGKPGSAPAKHGTDGAFARQSRGFMGKTWDGADPDGSRIAQDPEFWALVWEVLLPGGFIIAFSSSRTYGWMQVAMEQAGFVTHPMIGWIQGQGFPKAHNASKAIDQQLGTKRKATDRPKPGHEAFVGRGSSSVDSFKNHTSGGEGGFARPWMNDPEAVARYHLQTEAGSPEAAAWEGWAYGLQTLKPSLEPIYVGQKPFDQKNGALNLLKHGVGAMNIDGCRVPYAGESDETETKTKNRHAEFGSGPMNNMVYGAYTKDRDNYDPPGRHPANVLHDGSDAVIECFPATAPSGTAVQRNGGGQKIGGETGIYNGSTGLTREDIGYKDDGTSAARFFNALPFTEGDEPPFIYHPKATKADRVVGCTVCGVRALRDPGCDCRDPEDPSKAARRQAHPTVKPVSLMRWLQRLVTPAGGTTLDPFAGSGTSGSAAVAEGFNVILIEREDDYVADIRARLGLAAPFPDDLADLLGGVEPADDLEDLLA